MGSRICSDGRWNDRWHGLSRHTLELDTSCLKDKRQLYRQMEICFLCILASKKIPIFFFFKVGTLFSFRFYTSSQVFGKIMHLMAGWQSWVQDLPVVEAVFVGSGLTDGFTGNRGGVGGLACSRRLPHTYIDANTEENIHIPSYADIRNHSIDYTLKKSCK